MEFVVNNAHCTLYTVQDLPWQVPDSCDDEDWHYVDGRGEGTQPETAVRELMENWSFHTSEYNLMPLGELFPQVSTVLVIVQINYLHNKAGRKFTSTG